MKIKKIFVYIFIIINIIFIDNKVIAGSDDSYVSVSYLSNVYYSQNGPNGYHSNKQGIIYAGDRIAYCIEPEVLIKETLYDSYNGIDALSLSSEVKNHIQLLGHYGYEYPGHQTDNYYLATQELIWEYLTNISVDFYTGKNATGTKINIENEILTLVNRHYIKPSFNLNTITAYVGETITLTDTNNALSKFDINYNGSHTITKSGNLLTIKISDNKVGTEILSLKQNGYDNLTTIVYKNPGTQTLASLRIADPILSNIRIVSLSGKVTIEKQDKDTKISQGEATLKGAQYGIYDENNNRVGTLITDENGKAKIEDLYLGSYFLIEKKSSNNNMIDKNKYYFELKYKDQYTEIVTSDLSFKNYLPKGTLEFTKSDLITGKTIPNTKIQIFTENDELIYTGYTDENGKIVIKDLPIDLKMYIKELEPATGYNISDEKIYFKITKDKQVIKVNMKNEKIEVPDTGLSNINWTFASLFILVLFGLGLIIYGVIKYKK